MVYPDMPTTNRASRGGHYFLSVRHVIWDWNGTLFDDFHLLVDAASATSQIFGGPAVDAPSFREHHVRPLSLFYERLLGRQLTETEWKAANESFHDRYAELAPAAALAVDAVAALDRVAGSGGTQSLLSMWIHDSLVTFVERIGIHHYFLRVDGLVESTGDGKLAYMIRHIDRLRAALDVELDELTTVVIGDSADDGIAAREAGVSAVLVPTGVQHRDALEATGWPVSDSLLHAVEIAGFRA